jgi:hypothetical protein
MMVVVPTSKTVRMSYEPSRLDNAAYLFTLLGIVMVAFMFRRRLRYGVAMPDRIDAEFINSDGVSANETTKADSLGS